MPYNFEDSSIVVGQIKELLHNFNLPLVPVWSDDVMFNIDGDPSRITPNLGRTYIKDGKIQKYTLNGWKILDDYLYNREVANFTRNLIINSSIYDSYTHEYLGDYLRFIRDYHHINLMSLYNCFGYRRPSRIYKKFALTDGVNELTVSIDTDNTGFNYYIIPVKFNQTYTIGLDAATSYDICCILYSNNFVTEMPETLLKESYRTISGSKLTSPFIYNTNFSCANTCWDKEKDLMLLLRLPNEINSTITILEGNYKDYCSIIDGSLVTKFNTGWDKSYKDKNVDDKYGENYPSKLSLLRVNNGKSYPFADRLVEFLLGHMITPIDDIDTNIERVQTQVYPLGIKGNLGIWDDRLRNNIYKEILKKDVTKGSNDKYGNLILKEDGEDSQGEPVYKETREIKRFIDVYNDLTGFVDKDTEIMLEAKKDE